MNGQNKSGQLTFESTIEPVEKTKTETPVFETRNDVRVVRVLPDVPAIDKTFDYLVPESWIKDGQSELK